MTGTQKGRRSSPLCDSLGNDDLARREFVRRAISLGVGLAPLGGVLAGCRPRGGEGTASSASGPLERDLAVYNWSDYIDPTVLADFERESGVRVTYDTYESNEELLAKLQAGGTGYDLVCPSGYVVPVLAALDLLRPLDHSALANWDNVSPLFLNRVYDPEQRFGVPWQWGTSGVAWRSDLVPAAPDSWSVFHDGRYRGKMTQMDDLRDVIGAWLKFRGHSLNATDRGALETAKTDALVAKPLLRSYVSAPVKAQLIAGDVWICQLWSGDTRQAALEQPALRYAVPREGGMIWTDYMVIPKSAPHPRAAHAFLDFMLRPDIGARISAVTRYGTPNQAAQERLPGAEAYPTPEELARLEYPVDLGEHTALWDRIWTEIKSG